MTLLKGTATLFFTLYSSLWSRRVKIPRSGRRDLVLRSNLVASCHSLASSERSATNPENYFYFLQAKPLYHLSSKRRRRRIRGRWGSGKDAHSRECCRWVDHEKQLSNTISIINIFYINKIPKYKNTFTISKHKQKSKNTISKHKPKPTNIDPNFRYANSPK
jgi:hypothetical protein